MSWTEKSILEDIVLTDFEREYIDKSVEQYKEDLTNLVKNLKAKRLFDSLEPIIEEKNDISKDDVMFPEALLYSRGFYPMVGPVGCNKDGEAIRAKMHKLEDIPSNVLDAGFSSMNVALLEYGIQKAKELNLEYLYMISRHEGKYFIRGC
jgi:hypothetical protein